MNLQEILGVTYLLWPITIFIFILGSILGILLLVSIGGFVALSGLFLYYSYIYLKKKGVFQDLYNWIQKKTTLVTDNIQQNIAGTFHLEGIEKLSEKPTLYLAHPHGLFSMAPFVHWGVQLGNWPTSVPVKIAIHSIFFQIPGVRELMESNRCIEANENEIRSALESGVSVIVLTGGVEEISKTEAGQLCLVLKKRKGVYRIAKELGIPIVPVLTFGENELFPPMKHWLIQKLQTYLYAWFHIALPIPTWESLRNWFSLVNGPLEPAIVTWIGSPIFPKKDSVNVLRKKVLGEFEILYKNYKPSHYAENLTFV